MPTFAWRLSGRIVVLAHARGAPAEEEWAPFVAAVAEIPRPDRLRAIVYTVGGAPRAAQRNRLALAFRGYTNPVAVVTRSVAARIAARIAGWINPQIRCFREDRVARAFDYLGLDAAEAAEAAALVAQLAQAVQVPLPPAFAEGQRAAL